jgi:cobalamin biosynthesis protein CobT
MGCGEGGNIIAGGSTYCITFLDAGRKRASPDVAKDGKKSDAKRRKSSKGKQQEAADEEEAGSDSEADVAAAADADGKDDAAVSEDGDAGGCS